MTVLTSLDPVAVESVVVSEILGARGERVAGRTMWFGPHPVSRMAGLGVGDGDGDSAAKLAKETLLIFLSDLFFDIMMESMIVHGGDLTAAAKDMGSLVLERIDGAVRDAGSA